MSDAWVVNASPLIFLGNAEKLDLLRLLAPGRVLVPDAVWVEVTSSTHLDRASAAVSAATWLQRVASTPVPPAVVEWDLGAGESAVIAAALDQDATRVVVDDLSGRRCALSLGLDVTGTLGLVIVAHRRGLIGHPRAVLHELREAGMWLSDATIAKALRIAGVST
jgi:predicted nucleic acid-binding protein